MAKGTAMGLWKGKKGSSVFYRIANSNSAQKQGIRERAYEIANPRTTSQAGQRMKLLPAQRVYGVLKPIISRSWQGVNYGVESKQEFLKRALKLTTGYPYLEKDSSVVIPGAYQISKGTIQEVTTKGSEDPNTHASNLLGVDVEETQTFGYLSERMIQRNPQLQNGDQITIIGYIKESEYPFNSRWVYKSIFLDVDSNEPYIDMDMFSGHDLVIVPSYNQGGSRYLAIQTGWALLCASAVIISRLVDGQYQRSTAVMYVNEETLQGYFGGAAFRRARNSYMNPTRTQSTDWPIEPELPENSYTSDYALNGLTGSKAQCNGIVVLVTRNEETDALTGVFVKQYLGGNALVKKSDGEEVTYEVESGGEVEVFAITPADQPDLANLPTIPYE